MCNRLLRMPRGYFTRPERDVFQVLDADYRVVHRSLARSSSALFRWSTPTSSRLRAGRASAERGLQKGLRRASTSPAADFTTYRMGLRGPITGLRSGWKATPAALLGEFSLGQPQAAPLDRGVRLDCETTSAVLPPGLQVSEGDFGCRSAAPHPRSANLQARSAEVSAEAVGTDARPGAVPAGALRADARAFAAFPGSPRVHGGEPAGDAHRRRLDQRPPRRHFMSPRAHVRSPGADRRHLTGHPEQGAGYVLTLSLHGRSFGDNDSHFTHHVGRRWLHSHPFARAVLPAKRALPPAYCPSAIVLFAS